MKVSHSYGVEGVAKTQRLYCEPCDIEYVATWVADLREAEHGKGAFATKKAIERGEIVPRVEFSEGAAGSASDSEA